PIEKAISCSVLWVGTAPVVTSSLYPRASIFLAFQAALLGRVLMRDRCLETLDIDDQGDVSVTEDGSAGDALDALEVLLEALDDHLLLADDVVDHQRRLDAALGLAQHHEAAVGVGGGLHL